MTRRALDYRRRECDYPYEGTRIGDMTRCRVCGKAIQLIRSRTPETQIDHDFWVHYAALVLPDVIETHKAITPRVFTWCSDQQCPDHQRGNHVHLT